MHTFGGSWSESKLDCVEKYTKSYLKVMQNQKWFTLHYVDAFAGRGKHRLKSGLQKCAVLQGLDSFFGNLAEREDTEEFLVGSAIRALRASSLSSRPFDYFLFVDADQASCSELESIIQDDFGNIRDTIKVKCGDANATLEDYISKVDWNHTRALIFLDPYGLEVSWNLIKRLAKTGSSDIWYLFPLGGVLRMMTKDGHMPDPWRARLDRVFGTSKWYEEFYCQSTQRSLFGEEEEILSKNASTGHVVDFIRVRLKTVFPAISRTAILRNGKGAPLFALVLGVSNPSPSAQKAALRIANYLIEDLNR